MTWTNTECMIEWCYVCEKDLKYLDQESGGVGGGVGSHYSGWKENTKRCPQFLRYLAETDSRYSENEAKNLFTFHKLLVLKNMKKFHEKHGEAKYNQLCCKYPQISRSKYKMNDAKTLDLTLFKRQP